MAQVLTYALGFLVFFAIYAFLLSRARRQGRPAEVRWGWLAAIVGCAALAIVLSFFM